MRFTDTEWQVMNAVWRKPSVTARDVLDCVADETGWAYTTVKTILARLVEKGALSASKRANTSVYEPLVTKGRARRDAVRGLLDRAFDGTFGPLFQHLIREEKLSRKDRAKLNELLQDLGPDQGKR